MSSAPRFTREKLNWYRSIPEFDRTHWWLGKNKSINFDHPELCWHQKHQKAPEKRSYAREPIFWEILRRHPELGPADSWKLRHHEIHNGHLSGKYSLELNELSLATPILWILHELGHKNWLVLNEDEKLRFKRASGALLRLATFNRDNARIPTDPIVADLSGDLAAQGLWTEHVLTLPTWTGGPGKSKVMLEAATSSDPFLKLAPIVCIARNNAFEIMVLRIDPSEDNMERIAGDFIRVYKLRRKNLPRPSRVRVEKLRIISDAEEKPTFRHKQFSRLFEPFSLRV